MKIKKEGLYWAVIIFLLIACGAVLFRYAWQPSRQIRVYYNRDTRANEQIINLIQDADHFVYFAVYTITRTDIADALVGAKYRGLDVVGVTDREQAESLAPQT